MTWIAKLKNKKANLFFVFVVVALALATLPGASAQVFKFFDQEQVITSIASSSVTSERAYPEFFFNVPFNLTYFGYLGGNFMMLNWSMTLSENSGAGVYAATVRINASGTGVGTAQSASFDRSGNAKLYSVTGADSIERTWANTWTNVQYNFSSITNFTTLNTNVTTFRGGNGAEKEEFNFSTVQTLNVESTLFLRVTSGGIPGTLNIDALQMFANFDKDYWSGGTYSNFTNRQYFPDEDAITINFTAPTLINASYILNNATAISLCTNCQNNTFVVSGAQEGGNNLTLNFTFIKNDTLFSLSENYTFTAGRAYALCEDNQPDIDQEVFNVTFFDEENQGTQITSNYTVKLFDTSVLSPFLNEGRDLAQSFTVCFINDNATREVGFEVKYRSADGTFDQRVIGTLGIEKININVTDPFRINAFLLSAASATTITFTIEDESSVKQAGLQVKASRFDTANNTFIPIGIGGTDLNGIVQFEMILDDFYRLEIFDSTGTTLLRNTGAFKITETSYTIVVNLNPSVVGTTQQAIDTIEHSLVCNPDCNFTIQWVNATWDADPGIINFACLELSNRTELGNFGIINTTCVAANNETILMNVTDFNMSLLHARFYVNAVANNIEYTLATLDIDLRRTFERWGALGLFIALFMIFTIIGALALSSARLTVIMMMFGTLLLYLTGMVALTIGMTMIFVSFGFVVLWFMDKRG